ncbi:hypothetical protein ACFQX6_31060 [Streptosporangium lutulentum]
MVLHVDAPSDQVRRAVSAALEGTVGDVLVTLVAPWSQLPEGRHPVLDDPFFELRTLREYFSHDERVRLADKVSDTPAPIPFRYTGPVSVPLGDDSLERMIGAMQKDRPGMLVVDLSDAAGRRWNGPRRWAGRSCSAPTTSSSRSRPPTAYGTAIGRSSGRSGPRPRPQGRSSRPPRESPRRTPRPRTRLRRRDLRRRSPRRPGRSPGSAGSSPDPAPAERPGLTRPRCPLPGTGRTAKGRDLRRAQARTTIGHFFPGEAGLVTGGG